MLSDRVRVEAYVAAIDRVVRPGDVVADVGSGTGIFSLAACRAGARRVYAIEPGAVATLARTIVEANAGRDRVTLIQETSDRVRLPEPVDVVVIDVRGVLPDRQIQVSRDARQRWLRPGGHMLPLADEIWAAPVTAPALYRSHVGAWARDACGVDVSAARRAVVNTWVKCRTVPGRFLAPPRCLGTIDYTRHDKDEFDGRGEWTSLTPSDCHGFVVWFDSRLVDGIRISNRPGEPDLLYGQGYLPWPEPVRLSRDASVAIELHGFPTRDDYEWRWRTEISGAEDQRATRVFDQGPSEPGIGSAS